MYVKLTKKCYIMHLNVQNATCEYVKDIPKFGTRFYEKTDLALLV